MSACSGSSNGGSSTVSSAAPAAGGSTGGSTSVADGTTITLAMVNGLQPQFQKYVDAYQTQYPKRKVTVQTLPDDNTQFIQQLTTERLGGKLPDLTFNVDNSANRLAAANITYDISPWLKEGKDGLKGSNFLPQFMAEYSPLDHPSQITGLPVSADSTALFYNKTIFNKYGVALPTATWTWDDMYKAATEIYSKSGGKVIGLSAPLQQGGHQEIYNPVIAAEGGYVYDPKTKKSGIGDPAAIKAWTLMLQAYGTAQPAYSNQASAYPVLQTGTVAMAFTVRAAIPTIKATTTFKDDWDAAPMPTLNGKTTVGGGSYGLSITSTSKNKDAAWAFLVWFYDNNGGMKLAQESGQVLPPTIDGLAKGTWRNSPKPPSNQQIFADDAKVAVLAVQLPGKAQGILDTSVITAIQQVELQKRSVADAFGDAAKSVNDALASGN